MNFDVFLEQTRRLLENQLDHQFQTTGSPYLADAVRYSLLNSGKRIRPALVRAAALATNNIDDQESSQWLTPAMAVEMVHVYSLVHDDLPAMDNDDLRRGKPTNHKQYNEATAILAGDALLTEAFALISRDTNLSDQQVRQMVLNLSEAAGASGMVGGQMIDLQSEHQTLTITQLEELHSLKTGALIQSSLALGALCSKNPETAVLENLKHYGYAIGLAFQIVDDILDVTSNTETLGKPQGSDSDNDKSTYVKLLGLQGAKDKANEQHQKACSALSCINQSPESPLWQLADFILQRKF